jgi:hypothetical protein
VRRALLVLGSAFVLTAALFTPFCGVVHRCGCQLTESRCNVANETGPHCPWCEHRSLGALVFACVAIAEGTAVWVTRKKPLATCALATLGAFPVAGLVFSALAWLPTDYPHFLALEARATLHLPPGPIPCHGHGSSRRVGCCHVGGQ